MMVVMMAMMVVRAWGCICAAYCSYAHKTEQGQCNDLLFHFFWFLIVIKVFMMQYVCLQMGYNG
jgi:hypothetical protein